MSQVPARALDHPQIAVHDVAKAMDTYGRLGFTLAPRMFHSFGTSNCLITFDEDYLELLGDFDNLAPEWRGRFALLAAGEGLAHLGLFSDDAEADHAGFVAAGAKPRPLQTFTRPVPLPDGAEDLVRCSVTGVARDAYPGMVLFACHQHRPDLIWRPEWQNHPNTAFGVAGVTYASTDPSRHRDYLELMIGPGATRLEGETLRVDTGREGFIEVIPPAAMQGRFGAAAHVPAEDDVGVAVRLRVRDLTALIAILKQGEAPFFTPNPGLVTIPAGAAHGVILEFVA